VIVHHAHLPDIPCGATIAAEKAAMKSMNDFHKGKGWGGIGYQWAIFQSARIYEGRGWGRTGAHTIDYNSSSQGVIFVIDGEKNTPTAGALESFDTVVREGIALGHIIVGPEIAPHDQFQQKVCPGSKVKLTGILTGAPMPVNNVVKSMPTLRIGKGGALAPRDIFESVRSLQRMLGMPSNLQTGFFGEKTHAAVIAFQVRSGLLDDGIVGMKTWKALGVHA
jgi:hypothetical protein